MDIRDLADSCPRRTHDENLSAAIGEVELLGASRPNARGMGTAGGSGRDPA